ncbi:hypothetical protein GX586_13060 [bacterium]|nr:hypothetical protein [bacterium]
MKTAARSLAVAATLFTFSILAGVKINGAGPVYPTIQAAVNAAVDGDKLHVSTGRYAEAVAIYNKSICVEGNYSAADYTTRLAYASTIVDGSGTGASAISITNGSVCLWFLKVTGGTTPGGGVKVRYATATAEYCIVYGNNAGAASSGGGVFVSAGSLLLNQCTITNNTAMNGGGLAASLGGTLTVRNCTVRRNRALAEGGALYVLPGARAELEYPNTDVRHNYAQSGGGASVSGGELVVRHSAGIFANSAWSRGGGIYAHSGADVLLDNCTVGYEDWGMNWVSNGCGGGLYADDAVVRMTNADVRSNFAFHDGGGAYVTNATLDLVYGVSFGSYGDGGTNVARRNGGGVCAVDSAVSMRNSYFEQCIAHGSGGGIHAVNSRIECRSSILGRAYGGTPRGNTAFVDGGALYAAGTTVALNDTRVDLNTADDDGGGFYLLDGSGLYATNAQFTRNAAGSGEGHRGGAICAFGSDVSVALDDCQVVSNTAGDEGGAVYWSVNSPFDARARTVFEYNRANDHGGAIYALAGRVRCTDSGLRYNVANDDDGVLGDGGAMYLTGGAEGEIAARSVSLLVRSNRALNGGACSVTNGASLVVTSAPSVTATVYDNEAAGSGGAFLVAGAGSALVLHNVAVGGPPPLFNGNVAHGTEGGGGGIAALDGARLTARNCSVYGNRAAGRGGGICASHATVQIFSDGNTIGNVRPAGRLMLNVATNLPYGYGGGVYAEESSLGLWRMCVLSNLAARGGGIHSDIRTELWLVNAIVAANRDYGHGAGLRCYNSTNYVYHCTIAHNISNAIITGGVFPAVAVVDSIVWGHPGIAVSANAAIEHSDVQGGYAGAGNISADPLFFDAAAYDYGIGDGSPCIDTGVYAGIETDCLGVSRPQLSTYDMGAYEYVPEPQAAWLLACLVFTAVCGRAGRRRAPP